MFEGIDFDKMESVLAFIKGRGLEGEVTMHGESCKVSIGTDGCVHGFVLNEKDLAEAVNKTGAVMVNGVSCRTFSVDTDSFCFRNMD